MVGHFLHDLGFEKWLDELIFLCFVSVWFSHLGLFFLADDSVHKKFIKTVHVYKFFRTEVLIHFLVLQRYNITENPTST